MFNTGIDIGSTTIKIVVTNIKKNVVFSEYIRHNTQVSQNLYLALSNLINKLGDIDLNPVITGSVGMGVAEKLKLPFMQEVIVSAEAINQYYPDVQLFIDIGGEDAKLIYFRKNGYPDIRMNGNCAGGTGAYIDQMASLLNIPVGELDKLATKAKNTYPVSSRCGVFAKTDIQSLLSRQVSKPDIAKSIYNAVAVQVVNTLMQGDKPLSKIIFSGGPLIFSKSLQKELQHILKVEQKDIIIPQYGNVFPALGASISEHKQRKVIKTSQLAKKVLGSNKNFKIRKSGLKPLFKNPTEFEKWNHEKNTSHNLQETRIDRTKEIYIGVDAGSSTTKLIAINQHKKIIFSHYENNKGQTIKTVAGALKKLNQFLIEQHIKASLKYSIATGYGEELVKKAFNFDEGIVETIAHYKAAAYFDPNVSFILDIGGQDMKAIFIENGHIKNIEINEACSSGCGTFIETFANSLGISVKDFAQKANFSENPYDLGTRCTVFMNSKLKQALREGAKTEDISAGLAYAVIKNCFTKVLKIKDFEKLGNHIVVQGGTFLNPAVLKAAEHFIGKKITRPTISALMGAYGCALTAMERASEHKSEKSQLNLAMQFAEVGNNSKTIICNGCGNKCRINKITFSDNQIFYSGNRCEQVFSNYNTNATKGENLVAQKYNIAFSQTTKKTTKPKLRIGIPRVLNIFDNFPFWNTLLSELNIDVVLSSATTDIDMQKTIGHVMSDNICYPAKIVHAHIYNLIEKKVDRILYPLAKYEKNELSGTINEFNCPVVTGYPDVIKNTIDFSKYGITYDMLPITFSNNILLEKGCYNYLKNFNIEQKTFKKAFKKALETTNETKRTLQEAGLAIIKKAKQENRPIIMLVGRPYHADPAVHHNIPGIISDMGIDVVTEDIVPIDHHTDFNRDIHVLSQWQYSNRIYHAMKWVGSQENIHVIQMNSFGCGPDSVVIEEARDILKKYNKHYTVIRIDEGNNIAPVKLRIRSLIDALKFNNSKQQQKPTQRITTPPYQKKDRNRLIIGPNMSNFYSLLTESLFFQEGYNFELLPEADRESVEIGLKYVNNDICYPAIILVGDIIKALQSGKYDTQNVAVAMSETGGQCRASNYVSLIKKAMIDAGFNNIPVISLSTGTSKLNEQPGFKKKFFEMLSLSLNTLIFTDALLKLYNYTVVREKKKGEAQKTYNKYTKIAHRNRKNYIIKDAIQILESAVQAFNEIDIHNIELPKVGIVGEIFMKYNSFGNYNLENWLINNQLEVVTSPMNSFFLEIFEDIKFNNKNFIEKNSWIEKSLHKIINTKVDKYIHRVNIVLEKFNYPILKLHTIKEIRKNASELVSIAHQYGEGWLLPGEMATLAKEGVNNIISVQPFGCIACHIVSKGISKRFKDAFPHQNTLFIDIDADTSKANMHNRLEFFARNAHQQNNKKLNKTKAIVQIPEK